MTVTCAVCGTRTGVHGFSFDRVKDLEEQRNKEDDD